MYYLSAVVAITGAVGYQYFVKRVPNYPFNNSPIHQLTIFFLFFS